MCPLCALNVCFWRNFYKTCSGISIYADDDIYDLFHSNHNYCLLLHSSAAKQNCFSQEANLVSASTVITHNIAPQEEKKKKNLFLYLGAHHVFKSKCSIQYNLLLSIGLRIIHCSFIRCHADSTSSLCH